MDFHKSPLTCLFQNVRVRLVHQLHVICKGKIGLRNVLQWGISLIIEAVFRLAFVMPQTLCLQGLMLGFRSTEGSYQSQHSLNNQ